VAAERLGLRCAPDEIRPLIDLGMAIKRAVASRLVIEHPLEPDLGFLYGTIFVAAGGPEGVHSRNVCVFADGEVDRSPTGTGVSGRLAIHHARGELGDGEVIQIESITGSRFAGQVVGTTTCGPHRAVIPEIAGRAHITGRHEFLIDPDDPLRDGFLLR